MIRRLSIAATCLMVAVIGFVANAQPSLLNDPGSWLVDDEYIYGSSLPVTPLMRTGEGLRQVYLPLGTWIDYQTGKSYEGGWQKIKASCIQEIILLRDSTVIPLAALAQSTAQMDWAKIELVVFAKDATIAKGSILRPGNSQLREIKLTKAPMQIHQQSVGGQGDVANPFRRRY